VHVTGRTPRALPTRPRLTEATGELVERFTADVAHGLPAGTPPNAASRPGPRRRPVRAGMLKAGVGYWRIDRFERRVLAPWRPPASAPDLVMVTWTRLGGLGGARALAEGDSRPTGWCSRTPTQPGPGCRE